MKIFKLATVMLLALALIVSCACFVSFAADGSGNGNGDNLVPHILIALAIGFLVAFIVTMVMKSKLKSVRANNAAANYTREGSFDLVESREIFLYKQTTQTRKPQNNDND